MSKKSQLDKALENIDYQIAVLQAARAQLIAQRDAQIAKKATS